MRRLEAEHRAAPEMRLVAAPVVVVVWFVDGLVAVHVVHGETDRQGLHVAGLRLCRSAGFAGVGLGLETYGVFSAGEWQQVAKLGRVDHISGTNRDLFPAVSVAQRDGAHRVALRVGSHRSVGLQHRQLAARAPGQQHGIQHRQPHARLGTYAADPAAARVQVAPGASAFGQRIVVAVELAYADAQRALRACDAEALDPAMFVRRYGLAGELATDPVVFFAHHHGPPAAQSPQRSGDATQAAAYYENVCR